MAWLSLLLALLQAVNSLVSYMEKKQVIEGAQADMLKSMMEAALDLTNEINAARKSAADKFAASGGVPDDKDPYLRD